MDDEDYERLAQYKWNVLVAPHTVYATRYLGKQAGGPRNVLMHREITGAPANLEVDHQNHCGIDNRKSNLRVCTHRENLQNRHNKQQCTSLYSGVYLHKHAGKWAAAINIDGKTRHLGLFTDETEAHRAYTRALESLSSK